MINADANATHQSVIHVMEAARVAGMVHITLRRNRRSNSVGPALRPRSAVPVLKMSLASRLVAAWYAEHLTALTAPLVPLAAAFATIACARRAFARACYAPSDCRSLSSSSATSPSAGVARRRLLPLSRSSRARLASGHREPRPWRRTRARLADESSRRIGCPRGRRRASAARAHRHPVAVAVDRVAASVALLEAHPQCDVIVADDGLQHYRLLRNFEIVVVDAARDLQRRLALAGRAAPRTSFPPRRSRRSRRAGDAGRARAMERAQCVADDAHWGHVSPRRRSRADAAPSAFTGIRRACRRGHRQSGTLLRAAPLAADRGDDHAFPSHHRFVAGDLALPGAWAILMTRRMR